MSFKSLVYTVLFCIFGMFSIACGPGPGLDGPTCLEISLGEDGIDYARKALDEWEPLPVPIHLKGPGSNCRNKVHFVEENPGLAGETIRKTDNLTGYRRITIKITLMHWQDGDDCYKVGLLAHEFGHMFGILDHSDDPKSFMHSPVPKNKEKCELLEVTQEDREFLDIIY